MRTPAKVNTDVFYMEGCLHVGNSFFRIAVTFTLEIKHS